MNRISSGVLAVAIATTVAIAHPRTSVAADPCSSVVDDVAVPDSWQRIVKNGIVSYRAPSSAEALITATYEVTRPAMHRASLLRKYDDVMREHESRLGSRRVALSPVRQLRHGSRLQTCWWGEDAASQRKFVSVTRSWANLVQSYYYEAVGLSTGEFDERADFIFGQARALSPLAADRVRIPVLVAGPASPLQPFLELDGR